MDTQKKKSDKTPRPRQYVLVSLKGTFSLIMHRDSSSLLPKAAWRFFSCCWLNNKETNKKPHTHTHCKPLKFHLYHQHHISLEASLECTGISLLLEVRQNKYSGSHLSSFISYLTQHWILIPKKSSESYHKLENPKFHFWEAPFTSELKFILFSYSATII